MYLRDIRTNLSIQLFLPEQTLYTRADLRRHLYGSVEDKTKAAHEWCNFCNKVFFDMDELYQHLEAQHERCHLCKECASRDTYYENYTDLERHFDKEHHLCHDSECLANKFVVYSSAIDLQAHHVHTHLPILQLSKGKSRHARTLQLGAVSISNRPHTSAPTEMDEQEHPAPQVPDIQWDPPPSTSTSELTRHAGIAAASHWRHFGESASVNTVSSWPSLTSSPQRDPSLRASSAHWSCLGKAASVQNRGTVSQNDRVFRPPSLPYYGGSYVLSHQ